MNRTVTILLPATVMLALASVYLFWQLRSEREHARAVQESAHLLQDRAEQLEKERAALERKVTSLRRFGQNRDDDEVNGLAAPAPAGLLRGNTHVGPVTPQGASAMRPAMQPPPIPPEQRKLLARRNFGELFRELALAPQQVDALLALFASHEERLESAFREAAPLRPPPPEEVERRQNEFEGLNQRHQMEVATLLGAEKAAELEALKKTIPMRHELKQLRDHFEAIGTPISDEQKNKLLSAMREQATPPVPALMGAAPEQAIEQLRAWRSETSTRFRESAASVLSPEQLKELDAYDRWQASSMLGGRSSMVSASDGE